MSAKIDSVIPVILCGGSGTRLWPISRKDYPKQFHALVGDLSLFQETVLRIDERFTHPPVIITHQDMKFLVAHQMHMIEKKGAIIAEPCAQNSGPALLAASFYLQQYHPNSIMAAFASDHVIETGKDFNDALSQAVMLAEKEYITTLAIHPNKPSDAFGYIALGDKLDHESYKIKAFVEKPSIEVSKDYINKGYLWNSGNFFTKPELLIQEYQKHDPDTVSSIKRSLDEAQDDIGMLIPSKAYYQAKALSIDYAVMEKTNHAAVVRAFFPWSDAGTFQSLYDLSAHDTQQNAVISEKNNVTLEDSSGCYVYNRTTQKLALSGIKDMCIIKTDDVTHISPLKENMMHVKNMLHHFKEKQYPEALHHKKTYRPWGWYETIAIGEGFQTKKILVYPKGRLSLQMHHHRAEHWVVVQGTAEVINGDGVFTLKENQSTFIPVHTKHRLSNISEGNLVIIEVQSGDYLGEDDIVRFEDHYNRV